MDVLKEAEERVKDWTDQTAKTYYMTAIRENLAAIQIGRSVLRVLDERYEFKREEY